MEDLKLQGAMYNVVFQVYADKVCVCVCETYNILPRKTNLQLSMPLGSMGRGSEGHRRCHVGNSKEHSQVLHIRFCMPNFLTYVLCTVNTYLCVGGCRDLSQHKLVFRSKMGKSVDGDMVRFQVRQFTTQNKCTQ